MKKNICQSCGMFLDTEDVKGTNKDGSKSKEFCSYCFKDGEFSEDLTVEEMIEINLQYLDEYNKETDQTYSVNEARKALQEFLPSLKRWC